MLVSLKSANRSEFAAIVSTGAGEDQRISVDEPLQGGEVGMENVSDPGKGKVHDRCIQNDHEEGRNAIRRWWQTMGHARYPDASSLLITADCGGINGARVRLWKRELQNLADELGLFSVA